MVVVDLALFTVSAVVYSIPGLALSVGVASVSRANWQLRMNREVTVPVYQRLSRPNIILIPRLHSAMRPPLVSILAKTGGVRIPRKRTNTHGV